MEGRWGRSSFLLRSGGKLKCQCCVIVPVISRCSVNCYYSTYKVSVLLTIHLMHLFWRCGLRSVVPQGLAIASWQLFHRFCHIWAKMLIEAMEVERGGEHGRRAGTIALAVLISMPGFVTRVSLAWHPLPNASEVW